MGIVAIENHPERNIIVKRSPKGQSLRASSRWHPRLNAIELARKDTEIGRIANKRAKK